MVSYWQPGRTTETGFSMIEVLVSMLVLGIGVMGYAALQLKSVQMTDESYDRTQALFIAKDLIERVRANSSSVSLATYTNGDHWTGAMATNVPLNCTVSTGTASEINRCSAEALALEDIAQTRDLVRSFLAFGKIALVPCSQVYCVTVAWNESSIDNCDQSLFSDGARDQNAHCVTVEFYP